MVARQIGSAATIDLFALCVCVWLADRTSSLVSPRWRGTGEAIPFGAAKLLFLSPAPTSNPTLGASGWCHFAADTHHAKCASGQPASANNDTLAHILFELVQSEEEIHKRWLSNDHDDVLLNK
jgi:hypothetical protein